MKKIDKINFDDWDDEIEDFDDCKTKRVRFVKNLNRGDDIFLNGKRGIIKELDKDIGKDWDIVLDINGKIHEYSGYDIFLRDNIILEKVIK